MDEAWKILTDAGVPEGAPRPIRAVSFEDASVREAFQNVAAGARLDGRQRDALWAWTCAFRSHWPSRFAAVLGDEGERALARLEAMGLDGGRHVKLRRIAIENLAARL